MKKNNVKELTNKVFEILSADEIKKIAKETNALDERERAITIYSFSMIMLLANTLGKQLSLSNIITMAKENGLLKDDITEAGLSFQIQKRGYEFFKHLFNALLKLALSLTRRNRRKILRRFKKVKILDSTIMKLCMKLVEKYKGLRGDSSLKLNVRYDYDKGLVEELKISSGSEHDRKNMLLDEMYEEDTLYLMDLGYTDYDVFSSIDEHHNYFVVRVKINSLSKILKDLTGEHSDWEGKYINNISNVSDYDCEYDLLVELENGLVVRMVKLYDDDKKKYYRYYTNLLEVSLWSKEEIKALYTYRWSIEIFFRDLKYVLGCVKVIYRTEDRILSQLYSSLCYYLIVRIFMLLSSEELFIGIDNISFLYSSNIVKGYLIRLYKLFKCIEYINDKDDLCNIVYDIGRKGKKKHYNPFWEN